MQQQLVSSVVSSLFQIILGPPATLLIDSLIKEGQVLVEFRALFSEIKSHLEVLQAFMVDASRRKRKEPHLRRALARLMELIYDTENILADCQTRLKDRSILALCSVYSPSQLLFRYQTAKRLKQIKMEIEGIEKNLEPFKLLVAGEEINQTGNARSSSHHVKESEIVGLEGDTERIKDWILYQNRLSRVAIVGMGGLGKTTIAQRIFNNTEVENYFEVRVWMSVSAQVIEKELLKTFWIKSIKGIEQNTRGEMIMMLLTSIKLSLLNKKFLIVLDDVWSIDGGWWDQLIDALPEDNGSSIIVTTRDERVAKKMRIVEYRIHRPKCLNDEESWFLFTKITFLDNRGRRRNPPLEDVGKAIVKKCKGLPLAIKAMAGILRLKPSSPSHWQKVADNFESEIVRETDTESSEVKASLRLSYDALPLRLKQCVLCFSIFPEDFTIDVEQLVYWWVGEGFAYAENGRTTLESAYDSLSELVSRCLVEVADQGNYDGRIYSCKMHDLVRDTIIKIAEEDEFCKLDDEKTHHLGLTNYWQVGDKLAKYSKLWAFLITNKPGSSAVKLNYLPWLSTSVRVLDLSSSDINDHQLRWICSLRYLTCISFKGVVGIKELPGRIKKLRNLQILVLTDCTALKTLPDSLMMLKNLTVLDVGNCTSLRHLPRGLGKLSNLQVLSGFHPASSTTMDSSQLTDLENLTQLRILRMCITEEDQIISVNVDLSRLNHLQILDISIGNSRGDENLSGKLDLLVPSNCLRELYLRNFKRETRPTWLNPVQLPRLEYLFIENGDLKKLICVDKTEIWAVEGLCLKKLPELELEWKRLKSAMSRLKYVEVNGCPRLKDFEVPHHPLGIWRVPKEGEEEEEDLENVCLEDEIEKLKR
ncbi:LOW QUALITY PROTEIN: disease resistance RPP13-like protein 4 [Aristolochia californica]|uniref:LOW QUALITY PROTEIN: disease resistance RPP13-like protein 4 n=1 Tax=Aristolochia californica TaxID=171875 RepID=UPI0035DBCB30